jgi:hypothetical protein
MAATGVFSGQETVGLTVAALGEILLGLLTALPRTSRLALIATIVAMPILLFSAIVTAPAWLVTPFNAPTLVLAMLALAVIALLHR